MLRKLLKERAHLVDDLRIFGAQKTTFARGIRMPDGSPVPVDIIMKNFGVPREQAEEIARRQTR